MDKWKEKAKNNGLCINCGINLPKYRKTQRCEDCSKKNSSRSSDYVKNVRRKRNDVCHYCGKLSKTIRCKDCADKASLYRKKRYNDFKKLGVCVECGDKRLNKLSVCKKHFLMNTSKNALKSTKYWEDIDVLFNKQNGMCFYTGIKIEYGNSASIDHVIPKASKSPDVYTLDNLVWCDMRINLMKGNKTAEEFIELCKIIVDKSEPVELPTLVGAMKQEAHPIAFGVGG